MDNIHYMNMIISSRSSTPSPFLVDHPLPRRDGHEDEEDAGLPRRLQVGRVALQYLQQRRERDGAQGHEGAGHEHDHVLDAPHQHQRLRRLRVAVRLLLQAEG